MLEAHAKRVQQQTSAAINTLNCDLTESTQALVADVHKSLSAHIGQVDSRVSKHDQELEELRTRTEHAERRLQVHDDALTDIRKELKELAALQRVQQSEFKQMASQQDKTAAEVTTVKEAVSTAADVHQIIDPAFTRPPNRTILWLSTNNVTVKRDDVAHMVRTEWLSPTFRNDQWYVDGPEEGSRWSLHFNSLPEAASLQASKARGLLQTSRGVWRELLIGTTKVYVNFDESPQVSQTGAAAKLLARMLKEAYPDFNFSIPSSHRPRFHPKKAPEAILVCDMVDLASVSMLSQFEAPQ
eukprot:12417127-Karenia_brevis.AAC.1